ncbi:hypothetical protein PQJ75_05495 [Rhodoplanes sp. TEM]|uniref:PD-(D/E)XK endonuclease-like domain-containing protein n=1 Tax=Rhodoplanes tepidamans TaxID=200616 RepID=A0ABT5J325_RHOTP|nr:MULTISPECIES: hypothetical protein [Rhodoplanes]MDC7784082.1 hypothetical protein [Rhodoplanes tepidamans]MDC7983177.1 hypothetical protein [Rhodoplanes sp. TEM]MDQ0356821.1 hypothetical protein [Rhodoplanes tepidamans]
MTTPRDLTDQILRYKSLVAAENVLLGLAELLPPGPRRRAEWLRIKSNLAFRRVQLALVEHIAAEQKAGFNPDQPRVPAGHPDGGQWTSGGRDDGSRPEDGESSNGSGRSALQVVRDDTGQQPWESHVDLYREDGSLAAQAVFNRDGSAIRSEFASTRDGSPWDERHTVIAADGTETTFQTSGATQSILDGTGQVESRTAWTSDGPEAQAFVQPAYYVPVPHPAAAAVEAALVLYTWMSTRNSASETAVLGFRADAYTPGQTDDSPAIWVGKLTRDEVDDACPRHSEVQSITDQSAEAINRGTYDSAASYGTAVHKRIEETINGPTTVPRSPPPDPNFRAEASLLKSDDAGYGMKGSRRIDVLENPGKGTVCIYDIKTGGKGLTPARMRELASTVQFLYPGTMNLIVTEVRPRR